MNLVSYSTTSTAHLTTQTQLLLQYFAPRQHRPPSAPPGFDADAFMHLLDSHRLTTVFYDHIDENDPALPTLKHQLRARYSANKFRMLAYVAELCHILRLCQHRGIEAVALKGPVLGQLYYDDYTQRECGDLDILVRPADVEATYQLLREAGYALTTTLWNSPKQKALYTKTYYHYNLYHAAKGVQIELHWRLNTSANNRAVNVDTMRNRLTSQPIGGLEIPVLSAIDNFIYLCIHGSTHGWKRLFWVQDIARIVQKEGHDFLEDAYRQAIDHQVDRFVLAGCHLAGMLFGVSLPDTLLKAIEQSPIIGHLSANFIFAINHVTDDYQSPISSFKAFRISIKKLIIFYESAYYLGGRRAVFSAFKNFFINPDYWRIYSFSDRFFTLNYVAAPFLWAYSAFSKRKA